MLGAHLLSPIVLILFACLPILQAQEIPSDFSTPEEHYLYFDQNFNVIQRLRTEEKRKENLMSEDDKKPVAVSIFEADLETIKKNLTLSSLVDASDLERVKSADGKIYIPCLDSDRTGLWLLRAKFGSPKYTTFGRKVLSRATYYIEPVGPTGGFFAKFVPHIPGFEQKVEREILVNDYVKSQLAELPSEMRNMTMDSFMGVSINFFGIPFSVAYRSASRIQNKPDHVRPFPGHGLLGCDPRLQEYAMKRTGLSDPEKAVAKWKQEEYLPKLARYTAWTHHVLGVSFESHTQNMVLDINSNTGEIIQFYFRDFADVLLNPIPLIAEGRLPNEIQWDKVKLLSIHPNYFSDQSVQIAKDIWYHASIYSGQGITSHLTGFPRQQRHLTLFLKAYIAETERILGQSIPLDSDAQRVMQNLEDKISREEFYSGELQARSPLRNAMATVLKSVFEFAHQVKIQKIEENLKSAVENRDQGKLRRAFYRAMTQQRVVFMGLSQRESLLGPDTKISWLKATIQAYLKLGLSSKNALEIDFKILDDHIWAVDRITQKPLAVTVEAQQFSSGWLPKLVSIFKKSESTQAHVSGVGISCRQIHRGHP